MLESRALDGNRTACGASLSAGGRIAVEIVVAGSRKRMVGYEWCG